MSTNHKSHTLRNISAETDIFLLHITYFVKERLVLANFFFLGTCRMQVAGLFNLSADTRYPKC